MRKKFRVIPYLRLMRINVVYEDNHLLVINKPAGELVHGDQSGDRSLLDEAKDYIKRKYKKPGAVFLHPVHRIDRPVSGIVLYARTSKALERLTKAFKERAVEKTYLAVVDGYINPPKNTLKDYTRKDPRIKRSRISGSNSPEAKLCVTAYKQVATMHGKSLVAVRPITGRHHQIRLQLSHAGFPIIGDVKYGGPTHENTRAILLHHYSLSIEHPVKKEKMTWTCKPGREQGWQYFQSWYGASSLDEAIVNLNELK